MPGTTKPVPAAIGRHIYIQLDLDNQTISYSNKYTKAVSDSSYGSNLGAWVVVDAAPVPVPSALILLGSGLALIAGVNRKNKLG